MSVEQDYPSRDLQHGEIECPEHGRVNETEDGRCAACVDYEEDSRADALASYVPGYQAAVDRAGGDPGKLYRILKGRATKADELAG